MIRIYITIVCLTALAGWSYVFAQPQDKEVVPQNDQTMIISDQSSHEWARVLVRDVVSATPELTSKKSSDHLSTLHMLTQRIAIQSQSAMQEVHRRFIAQTNSSHQSQSPTGSVGLKSDRPELPGRFLHLNPTWAKVISQAQPDVMKAIVHAACQYPSLKDLLIKLMLSAHVIHELDLWVSESLTYRQALLNDPFFDGPEYLEQRFINLMVRQLEQPAWSSVSVKVSARELALGVGFWLRRQLDGSAQVIFNSLNKGLGIFPQLQNQLHTLTVVPQASLLNRSHLISFFNELERLLYNKSPTKG